MMKQIDDFADFSTGYSHCIAQFNFDGQDHAANEADETLEAEESAASVLWESAHASTPADDADPEEFVGSDDEKEKEKEKEKPLPAKDKTDNAPAKNAPAEDTPSKDTPPGMKVEVGGKIASGGIDYKVQVIDLDVNRALLKAPGEAVIGKELRYTPEDSFDYMPLFDGNKEYNFDRKGNVYQYKDGNENVLQQRLDLRVAELNQEGNLKKVAIPPAVKADDVETQEISKRKTTVMRKYEEPAREPAKLTTKQTDFFGQATSVEERTRTIDGGEMKVRSPLPNDRYRFATREVEIDGKVIKLKRAAMHAESQETWFYSEGEPTTAHVKMHVCGTSAEDAARLQKALLPLLEEMRARGEIKQYKTFDPNWMDSEWATNADATGLAPGPKNQATKTFTLYLDNEHCDKVARALDARLKKEGLTLGADVLTDTVGDTSRSAGESRRVSLERDCWQPTSDQFMNEGALLDRELTTELGKMYPTEKDGRFAEVTLRTIEKAAGIKEGQLTYDVKGELMFVDASNGYTKMSSNRYYSSEAGCVKTPGERTGRAGLYAVYGLAKLDPAKIYLKQSEAEVGNKKQVDDVLAELGEAKDVRAKAPTEQSAKGTAGDLVERAPTAKRDGSRRPGGGGGAEQATEKVEFTSEERAKLATEYDKRADLASEAGDVEATRLYRELSAGLRSNDTAKRSGTERFIAEMCGGKAKALAGAGGALILLSLGIGAFTMLKEHQRNQRKYQEATISGR